MLPAVMRPLDDLIIPWLGRLADRLEREAVSEVDTRKLVAWGRLRQSIRTSVRKLSTGYEVRLFVTDRASYAQYLHEGIEPHMPPVEPIMAWIRKKNIRIDGYEMKKGYLHKTRIKVKNGRIVANEDDTNTQALARRVAWAIAIRMKKDGRDAAPFLRDAAMRVLRTMPAVIQ